MDERRIHRLFQASVLLKGLHAAIECIGGLALAFVGTRTITDLVQTLTQHELEKYPRDFVATHLLAFAKEFSVETQHFYAFYLLSHGVVKLLLVVGLLKEKLWSYPASLVVLGSSSPISSIASPTRGAPG